MGRVGVERGSRGARRGRGRVVDELGLAVGRGGTVDGRLKVVLVVLLRVPLLARDLVLLEWGGRENHLGLEAARSGGAELGQANSSRRLPLRLGRGLE